MNLTGSTLENYFNYIDQDARDLEWDLLTGSQNPFHDVRVDVSTNNVAAKSYNPPPKNFFEGLDAFTGGNPHFRNPHNSAPDVNSFADSPKLNATG